MKVIEAAIRHRVPTAVAVLLLCLFGLVALNRIPIQLTPTLEQPEFSVTTLWPGASPHEIEREIVDKQEEHLKSLQGLVKMESSSSDSMGQINLTFVTGTNIDGALLKISNKLEQVPSYPLSAEKPIIQEAGVDESAMAWFLLQAREEDGFAGDVSTLQTFFEQFVKPELERVPGVARINEFGGREDEVRVIVDPAALAQRGITITELMAAIERENRNYSAGDFDEGKRRYVVRTIGEYTSPSDIEEIVVAVRNGVPVFLRDVGRAELSHRKPVAQVYFKGARIIAFAAIRQTGSNTLEVMAGLQEALRSVNRGVLADRGLEIVQAFDETEYINSSIDLVQQSLVLGGVLAVLVLLLFLRSRTSTLVVAIAIPISLIGTFLVMALLGRTLNVISLAGLAFAVGMVVDNSIVVLENIYRHRQMGKRRFEAALDGATEVWGAVLASTLTTVAVFIPIVFVQEEAGQLFRDIAIAISSAVSLSLVVSVTVIPSLSAKILGSEVMETHDRGFRGLWGGVAVAERFNRWVAATVHWLLGSVRRRLIVVVGFTTAAVVLSWVLMPKAEYLPTGNMNFLLGVIQTPPGHNIEENAELRRFYTEQLGYLWETPADEAAALPGGGMDTFWYVAMADQVFMGGTAGDASRVRELIPEFFRVNVQIPGALAFVFQNSLFQRRFGAGRTIDVELVGPELERLVDLGREVFVGVQEHIPGAQAQPIPSLDLGNPEIQVRTDRRRAAELGISNRELGAAVSVLIDGAKASDYQLAGQEIDIRVMADDSYQHRTQLVEQLPIATPGGQVVTLGSVADVSLVTGPSKIAHRERQRAITIQISPPEEMPLQEAMDVVETEILAPMRAAGRFEGLYDARLAGTADKLTQTSEALKWNLMLALLITYLVMAALFENFLYPLVILFSVPLAALGGFLGLGIVNLFTYQALDVLTMLGFVILVGTVVNNAILIVHQSLNHLRNEGMEMRDAITEATRNRIRPIFMSVSTSVIAMLPLVVFPGAGSELYRGLGSVVIGGLVVSTFFTLFLVPSLFSLVMEAREAVAARARGLSARQPAA